MFSTDIFVFKRTPGDLILKLWVGWFFVLVRLGGVLLFALFALVGYSACGFCLFVFNPFRFLYVISSKPTEDFKK